MRRKTRVLWVCNKVPTAIANKTGLENKSVGGWLDYFCEELLHIDKIELTVVALGDIDTTRKFEDNQVYIFTSEKHIDFTNIIKSVNPDIIHIWGTEYLHSNKALKASQKTGKLDKAVISIQGLVSLYGYYHYTEGLPHNVIHRLMPRDLVRPSSIAYGRKDFISRGKAEIETVKIAHNIIGRTDWDRAAVYFYNPSAKYYFCNECLRDSFYTRKWEISNMERHSIFISQCSYPVKGFHYVIEALKYILSRYPDTKVYTTGKNLLNLSLVDKLKKTSYQQFILDLIKKEKLEKHVFFLGTLTEKEMCDQYLKCHVFVSPSTIENSPNSVGEAMILGCPVVASDVGGVKNMLVHNQEGFVYQSSAPYMLAYYICKIFDDDMLARTFSQNARKHANKIFDRDKNFSTLLDIYNSISNKVS